MATACTKPEIEMAVHSFERMNRFACDSFSLLFVQANANDSKLLDRTRQRERETERI